MILIMTGLWFFLQLFYSYIYRYVMLLFAPGLWFCLPLVYGFVYLRFIVRLYFNWFAVLVFYHWFTALIFSLVCGSVYNSIFVVYFLHMVLPDFNAYVVFMLHIIINIV